MTSPKAALVPLDLPVLHIYRHLLREIGYLPPAISRFFSGHVRRRFHQHRDSDVHLKNRIARARRGVRVIRSANHGDAKAMAKLINMSFGRTDVLRRTLLSKFYYESHNAPPDSKELEAALDKIVEEEETSDVAAPDETKPSRPNHYWLDLWDKEKMYRLFQAQRTQEARYIGVGWSPSPINKSNENVDVPEETSWGTAPVPGLVRTKQAKWWKRNANKVKPPLGQGQWDLLGRLSQGLQNTDKSWQIPERRKPAKPMEEEEESGIDSELYRFILEPTKQIVNKRHNRWRRFYGPENHNPYFQPASETETKSKRWFKRQYHKVWQMTPKIETNPNTMKYNFEYGPPRALGTAPTERQMLIFEGVDKKGQPPAVKKAPTPKAQPQPSAKES